MMISEYDAAEKWIVVYCMFSDVQYISLLIKGMILKNLNGGTGKIDCICTD
jgi:hypothetical protein